MSVMTREQNERLVRTGPGTPMGRFFRSYWIPAMLSERLPQRDGPPIRIRLLGEDLVAFRDTDGRVGLMDEFCPHRRASLFYGRNEQCGLRCVFHGWKFDAAGKLIDTPTEMNPDFGATVQVTAYPTREAGGIVWTYMGKEAAPPPFPDWLFTHLPETQRFAWHYNAPFNYLQAVEADIDISHPAFLHGTIGKAPIDRSRAAMAADPQPKAFTREEPFGLMTVWGWETDDPARSLVWVDPYVVPCHTIVPAGRTLMRYIWHAWVPRDDESHWLYYIHFDPELVGGPDERRALEETYGHDLIDPENDYRSRASLENLHFVDRELQRTESFSGIRGIAAQDIAVLESMGPIIDRTREHVGSKDYLVIRLRKYLLDLLDRQDAGDPLPGLNGEVARDIDSRMVIVPTSTSFEEVLGRREWTWGDVDKAA